MKTLSAEQKLRKVWSAMIRRCEDPNDPAFHNYGGRGIAVCDSWHSFETFRSDMGLPAVGLTLERLDNNGPYSQANCAWATRRAQSRNHRRNRLITHQGETRCLKDWAENLGFSESFLRRRMDVQGLTFEQAVRTPKRYSIWRRARPERMERDRGLRAS